MYGSESGGYRGSMNPKETIQAALKFEELDPVPYMSWIMPDVAPKIDEHYGSDSWRNTVVPYITGGHTVGEAGAKNLGNGLTRSPYGYISREPLHHLEQFALSTPSTDGYVWPVAEELGDWDTLAEKHRAESTSFRLCGPIYGFFERGSFMRGVENILVDMIEHPQFVHDLFDQYLKLKLELIDLIIERIPVEAIFDGGDDCDQRGPMMGLSRWQEFIAPRLKAIIKHVHAKGLPVIFHMCGNVRPLVDDLLEMKLDGLESLQPEAMDVYELKRATAGRMALIGGLGMQSTMRFGTPEQVRTETRKLIRELGRGGGYVVAPTKPIAGDFAPIPNAIAYLETITNQDE